MHSSYQTRSGNYFSFYIDGARFFPVILEKIKQAREYIAIEMYLVQPGEMYDLLCDALLEKANEHVLVFLNFDAFGSSRIEKEKDRLSHPNIFLNFYNRISIFKITGNLYRNHRKIFIMDGIYAFTGGTGITDNFYSTSRPANLWHEVMIGIQGECVGDWEDLFFRSFPERVLKKKDIQSVIPAAKNYNQQKFSPALIQPGRVVYTGRFRYKNIQRSVIGQIKLSVKEILFVTPYFLPSWALRRALRKAAKRGVAVKLLLPGENSDHPSVRHMGRRFYYFLLRSGVKIYEYQPVFNHSKVYVFDDRVSIGSCNLDRWSHHRNLEANQEVYDRSFAREVSAFIHSDISKSREINLANWNLRSGEEKMLEKIWIGFFTMIDTMLPRKL